MSVINLQVGASGDDYTYVGGASPQTDTLTITNAPMGTNNTTDAIPRCVGVRFANVTIPHGALIAAAVLKMCSNGDWVTSDGIWYGEASDNPAGFATTADNMHSSVRPYTTASVGWNENLNRTAGTFYAQPAAGDWSAIVQEITDRAGWSSGNALVLIASGRAVSSFASNVVRLYDLSAGSGATLDITFTPPPSAFVPLADRKIRGGDLTRPAQFSPGLIR
jgi:hypothetical protein